MSDNHDPETSFEQAWREWTARPPQLSPEIAAQRISAHIQSRRRRLPWRWAMVTITATAVVLVVLAGSWFLLSPSQTMLIDNQLQIPSLGEGEVLVVESLEGEDYPKSRDRKQNVVVDGENRLYFYWSVDPPLRMGQYRKRS